MTHCDYIAFSLCPFRMFRLCLNFGWGMGGRIGKQGNVVSNTFRMLSKEVRKLSKKLPRKKYQAWC